MPQKNTRLFDKTDDYEDKVRPVVQKLEEVCGSVRIPMFFAAAVSCQNNENGEPVVQYKSKTNRAECDVFNGQETIAMMLLRIRGCLITPPKNVQNALSVIQDFMDTTDNDLPEYDDITPNTKRAIIQALNILTQNTSLPANVKKAANTIINYLQPENPIPATDGAISDMHMLVSAGGEVKLPQESITDLSVWDSDMDKTALEQEE